MSACGSYRPPTTPRPCWRNSPASDVQPTTPAEQERQAAQEAAAARHAGRGGRAGYRRRSAPAHWAAQAPGRSQPRRPSASAVTNLRQAQPAQMPADEGRAAPRTRRDSGHIRLAQSQALVHGQPCAGGQQTPGPRQPRPRAPSQTLSQPHPPFFRSPRPPLTDQGKRSITRDTRTALITGRSGAKDRLSPGFPDRP
jgi:hypothetical protein